jgi:hypothetical protein
MEDCRPMSTPMITNWKKLSASDSQLVDATTYRQLIGSLMYLVNTRPDICFAVNTLSQYMVEPRSVHMVGAKHVLRYVVGTVDYGLDYVREMESVWLATQIQTGQDVLLTGKAPQGAASVWGQDLFPGSVGSRNQLL